jgi:hypothetical protein
LTKHLHDETLKCHMNAEDAKIEVMPKIIDNTMVLSGKCIHTPENKIRVQMQKPKVAAKRTRLDRVTANLYDLEAGNTPEKKLNINFDFDLYQMEDY